MTNKENEMISIIMPAYNAEKTLGAAIESVISQTYPCWELIVVNDASRDGTNEIAQAYAAGDQRIRVLCNEKNCGVSETRLRGLQASRGQWIALLDSDDAWAPDKLKKQMDVANAANAKLIFTGSGYMDENGNRIDWMLHVPEKIVYRKLLKQNLISNSSVLIRKECYQEHLCIADGAHEDFVCWLRFLRTGETAYGIDEPLLIYRVSSGSKSGNKLHSAQMAWRAYRIVGLSIPETLYYMVWYTITGILKHRHLK
jgi:teichuronic acid biosynthesis glycosyltransferase TuaG